MIQLKRALLLFTAFLMLFSCDNKSAPNHSDLDIVGGHEPTGDNPGIYSAVALYAFGQGFCTGTLVAENLVITAAHCIEDMSASSIKIIFNNRNTRTDPAYTRQATEIKASPSYTGDLRRGSDIGWIKFSGGVPNNYHPIPILANPNYIQAGNPITLVGFGRPGSELQSDGRKRSVDVKIRQYSHTGRHAGMLFLGTIPNRGACYGDSGGPSYIKVNNKWFVVGATSGADVVIAQTRTCEDGNAIYTHIGFHEKWIEQTSGLKLNMVQDPTIDNPTPDPFPNPDPNPNPNPNPNNETLITRTLAAEMPIPDNYAQGLNVDINFPEKGTISQMLVSLDILHQTEEELEIALIHPNGERAILKSFGKLDKNLNQSYQIDKFNGQELKGTWTLQIKDLKTQNIGVLKGAIIKVKATPTGTTPIVNPDPNPVNPNPVISTITAEFHSGFEIRNITGGEDLLRTEIKDTGVLKNGILQILLDHDTPEDVRLTLTHPDGTDIELNSKELGTKYPLSRFNNKNIKGVWRLRLASYGVGTGILLGAKLKLEATR